MIGIGGGQGETGGAIVALERGQNVRRRSSGRLPEAPIPPGNAAAAARNRAWLAERNILMLDLVSAPGAGKTTLLERMVRDLAAELPLSVIAGGQAISLDCDRIRTAGARAVQLDTEALDAVPVGEALAALDPPAGSVVAIENTGLAPLDLGEWAKVALLSVTEGEDKPLKYAPLFRAARLMLLNKIDLLPHLRFDEATAVANTQAVNPEICILPVSALTGKGLACFYRAMRQWAQQAHGATADSGGRIL